MKENKNLRERNDILAMWSGNGRINRVLTSLWLEIIFTKEDSTLPALLIWDFFRAHTEPDLVNNTSKNLNVMTVVIPGGCTGKLQTLDVSLNHPFNVYLEEAFVSFMYDPSKHTFTKARNMRAPTKMQLCDMVI